MWPFGPPKAGLECTLLPVLNARLELELLEGVEVFEGLHQAGGHLLLAEMQPRARVDHLLVRLVVALGIADLGLQISVLVFHVLANRMAEGPLRIGVDVHLDDAVGHRLPDLLLRGAGAAVEDEAHGLRARPAFCLNRLLRVLQNEVTRNEVWYGIIERNRETDEGWVQCRGAPRRSITSAA